jgi:hypothetical protein
MGDQEGEGSKVNARFICPVCSTPFSKGFNYSRHVAAARCRATESYRCFTCEICDSRFARKDALRRHEKQIHGDGPPNLTFPCGVCEQNFSSLAEARVHRKTHILPATADVTQEFVTVQTAHRRRCGTMRYVFPEDIHFLEAAYLHLQPRLETLLRAKQAEHKMFKVSIVLNVEFAKISDQGELDTVIVAPFRSETFTILPLQELGPVIGDMVYMIDSTADEFIQRGSGWSLNDILFCDVEIAECKPLAGSCQLHEAVYKRKQGLQFTSRGFTGQSDCTAEDSCFYLAVASHFLPHGDMGELLDFVRDKINCCVPTPVDLKDVKRFEEGNHEQLDLSVNVMYREIGRAHV